MRRKKSRKKSRKKRRRKKQKRKFSRSTIYSEFSRLEIKNRNLVNDVIELRDEVRALTEELLQSIIAYRNLYNEKEQLKSDNERLKKEIDSLKFKNAHLSKLKGFK